jgi:pyruvate/2-oxoglutarate dehydrogenase complex dihydrolipoamide acyltransferase (E2) component
LVWWVSLNFFGRLRSHNYGTFGVTSTSGIGAGVQRIIPILTSSIHYGMFDEAGCLDMRLSFDHRVLDGATAAQALVDLEAVLLHEILDEVRGLRLRLAA